MLRFDPTKPEHSKYEVTAEPSTKKRTSKKEKVQAQSVTEEPKFEVSKEQFYKVETNLKEVFQEKQGFSLSDMFGTKLRNEKGDEGEGETIRSLPQVAGDTNPFVHDSSESEDEPASEPAQQAEKVGDSAARSTMLWSEPLFFKEDDYRLQGRCQSNV